jgi:hypothetical protein
MPHSISEDTLRRIRYQKEYLKLQEYKEIIFTHTLEQKGSLIINHVY